MKKNLRTAEQLSTPPSLSPPDWYRLFRLLKLAWGLVIRLSDAGTYCAGYKAPLIPQRTKLPNQGIGSYRVGSNFILANLIHLSRVNILTFRHSRIK